MPQEIKDQKEWDELVLKNLPRSGGFLGSWPWGEFQKQVGRPARRFAFDDSFAQAIEHQLPFGKRYWYLPRGSEIYGLEEVAKKLGVLFLRFEPVTKDNLPEAAQKTIHLSPPTTLILDLTKSEDELLAQMHEKTRYNIRLAGRKGVKISSLPLTSGSSFEAFWGLLQETARRDGFRTHSKNYYEKMLEIPWVKLWQAEWEGKIIAAGLWAYFGETVTYLHGASSSEYREVMAPHLLHWEIMRDAKVRGFKHYDFWGISLNDQGSWAGITRFKKGFGGEVVEYPGTYDLPLRVFWYKVYKFARKARRI